jgi:hypothetical protein
MPAAAQATNGIGLEANCRSLKNHGRPTESVISRQMSRSSGKETSSSRLPRRSRHSLIFTAVSRIRWWESTLPPQRRKFSPRVTRVCPSLLSKARPSKAADFFGSRDVLTVGFSENRRGNQVFLRLKKCFSVSLAAFPLSIATGFLGSSNRLGGFGIFFSSFFGISSSFFATR